MATADGLVVVIEEDVGWHWTRAFLKEVAVRDEHQAREEEKQQKKVLLCHTCSCKQRPRIGAQYVICTYTYLSILTMYVFF